MDSISTGQLSKQTLPEWPLSGPKDIAYTRLADPQGLGMYQGQHLFVYCPQAYKPLCTTSERNMSVLWGQLAADTLTQNYDGASEDLLRLREALDNQSFATPLMQLQQRTWLMHWSLHVFWNTENGKNTLIDMFLQPPYLSAIQINAQHLLR